MVADQPRGKLVKFGAKIVHHWLAGADSDHTGSYPAALK
jgi:hypothetical protein